MKHYQNLTDNKQFKIQQDVIEKGLFPNKAADAGSTLSDLTFNNAIPSPDCDRGCSCGCLGSNSV